MGVRSTRAGEPEPGERASSRRIDLLLAGALLALGQAEVALRGTAGSTPVAHAAWATAGVAVLARRAHPLIFFTWALALHVATSLFDIAPPAAAIHALYMPLALFGLGAYVRDPRHAPAAALLGLGVLVAARVGLDLTGVISDSSADEWLREVGIFAPVAAGGVVLRDRTEALRAARGRMRAASSGTSSVDLALSAERTRIARELHAVVAECVRAVLDEVGAARSTLAVRSGAVRAALCRARTASQQAMTEMRRMLVLLRAESPALGGGAAPSAAARVGAPPDARAAAAADAHADAVADASLPPAAMRMLVELAELPGCASGGIERGQGVVRAGARVIGVLDAARVERLAERARAAGGRLRRGRLRRGRLSLVLPLHARVSRLRHARLRVEPLLRAQGIPLLLLAIEVSEAVLAHGKPAEWYGTATVPVRLAGAVAISLAFVPRRRWPLATTLAVLAIAAVRLLVLDDSFGLNPPLYLAAFVAGAYVRPLWRSVLAGGAVGLGGVLIVGLMFEWDWQLDTPSVYLFFLTMATAAWITGVGGRRRLAEAEELRTLAAAEEQLQAAAIRHAVNEERLRVARELHDLVGHGLTSITLQCAGAERLLDTRPRDAAAAIDAVAGVGEEVLRELHELLAVLDGSRETDAPRLASVTALARRAAADGLDVSLELVGDVGAVPPGPAGAAYRIVQEALTNARKHGGAVGVGVRVAHERGLLAIDVRNALSVHAVAPAPAGLGLGLGLAGMRERVRLFDGWLTAGPEPDGTWAVRAELPLATSPAAAQRTSGEALGSSLLPSSTSPLS